MLSSHRPPDATKQSSLRRVWCAGVNWTIAINARVCVCNVQRRDGRRRLREDDDVKR